MVLDLYGVRAAAALQSSGVGEGIGTIINKIQKNERSWKIVSFQFILVGMWAAKSWVWHISYARPMPTKLSPDAVDIFFSYIYFWVLPYVDAQTQGLGPHRFENK